MKKEMYFAYGSNINMRQMKQRCPSAKFHSHAVLQGYQITFPLWSEKWGGGVAGIHMKKGKQVEGVVYEVSEGDLEELDKFEGVDKGHYCRKKVGAIVKTGQSLESWVYVPGSADKVQFPPSRKYLETILEGAKRHNFSKQYIGRLTKLLTKAISGIGG
ncbi:MAG: gamma-glutamylcyclotransferase family protein [Candidatus Hodarchaeota archaeon]